MVTETLESPTPTPTPTPVGPKVPGRLRTILSDNGPLIAAGGVAILFCVIIGSLFWPFLFGTKDNATLLRELSNFEVARGLITFLVAVTTVGIALILTVYVVVTLDQGVEKKFGLGKEVFTGLIGVLGTIVGFYFGAGNAKEPPKEPPTVTAPKTVEIKSLKAEPTEIKAGGTFKLNATTDGAKSDIIYMLTFKPDGIIKNITGTSDKPEFTTDISVPIGAKSGDIDATLQIQDKKTLAPYQLTGLPPKITVKIVQ